VTNCVKKYQERKLDTVLNEWDRMSVNLIASHTAAVIPHHPHHRVIIIIIIMFTSAHTVSGND